MEKLTLAAQIEESDTESLINSTRTVTVPAPELRPWNSDVDVMPRHTDNFAKLLERCHGLPPVKCAVVHPCDRDALLGAHAAAQHGLIDPVLVGPDEKIRRVAEAENIDISGYPLISTMHSHASADRAVAIARAGGVDSTQRRKGLARPSRNQKKRSTTDKHG